MFDPHPVIRCGRQGQRTALLLQSGVSINCDTGTQPVPSQCTDPVNPLLLLPEAKDLVVMGDHPLESDTDHTQMTDHKPSAYPQSPDTITGLSLVVTFLRTTATISGVCETGSVRTVECEGTVAQWS